MSWESVLAGLRSSLCWDLTVLACLLMPVGFVLLIKGADVFVEAASSLARRLRVSDPAAGLTIVAFGTSLPELAVNVTASIPGNAGITIGNIVGSNIANILLILGVSGLISPPAVTRGAVWKEIPLSLLAGVVMGIAKIAVGNVIGSSIFNIFFILGINSLIRPIPFEPRAYVDIGVLIFASVLLLLWMFTGRRRHVLEWRQAAAFLGGYAIYIAVITLGTK